MKEQRNLLTLSLKLLCFTLFSFSLNPTGLHAQVAFCGTGGGADAVGRIDEQFKKGLGATGPYYIKVYVYIIRRSDGTGGQTPGSINGSFDILNAHFNPHDIFFVRDCEIIYIDNDNYYNTFDISCDLWSTYSHPDGIDMFFGPNTATNAGGVASGVPGKALYVAGTWTLGLGPHTPVLLTPVISHEMGHCLGLWHTFHGTVNEDGTVCGVFYSDPNSCCELVDGTNAEDCGDYVEDTDADPKSWASGGIDCNQLITWCNGDAQLNGCALNDCPPVQDVNHDVYTPPVRNIMSYQQNIACIDGFTPGQGERMRQVIDLSPVLQAVLTTPPTVPPQLTVNVNASNSSPALGELITISVEVCNSTGSGMNGVLVTSVLPPGLNFSSSPDFTLDGTILTGTIAVLPAGGCVTLNFQATVTNGYSCRVEYCATAQFQNCASANDCLELTLEDAFLSVTMTVSNPNPMPGEVVTVGIQVCNLAPLSLYGITLTNPLPPGLDFFASTDFNYDPVSHTLTATPFQLPNFAPPGNCRMFYFHATANLTGSVQNCATAQYSICPPVTACVSISGPTASGCGISIVETCDPCGNVTVMAVNASGVPITPANYLDEFIWWVYGGPAGDNSGVQYQDVNPITVHPDACYSLLYEHFVYAPGSPHVPGAAQEVCRFELPVTCVSIECPGPCQNFPDFYIAGCGDDLDLSLNLSFPANCYNVCNTTFGSSVSLGVFYGNTAVDPNQYNILWENGSTNAYVSGTLLSVDQVKITSKTNSCCFWEDKYRPSCMCSAVPYNIQCEQPIIRYCHPNGTVTYTPQPPQIAWYAVPGATSYLLEITFDNINIEGCCTTPPASGPQYFTVTGSPWIIPSNWDCFTIRIKALNPNGICTETDWGGPYTYCEGSCSPVIITCGCCEGRSDGQPALPVVVIPEEQVKTYLANQPNGSYNTLEQALAALGRTVLTGPSFSVFPNPTGQRLAIRPEGAFEGLFYVRLYDLLQRERRASEMTGAEERVLDVNDLPQGVYLLTIRSAQGELVMAQKVSIMR